MFLLPNRSQFLQTGQSLIEIIIGATIAGIFILGASNLLNISSQSSARNKEFQSATFLTQELLENVSLYADAKWYCVSAGSCAAVGGLYNLNKGSANKYYLTAPSPFEWRSGEESLTVSDQVYLRHFYLENVCRDSSGNIIGPQSGGSCATGAEDPSSQKLTVVVAWTKNGQNFNEKLERYLTRWRNESIGQTDWSGGSGQAGLFNNVIKYDTGADMGDGISGGVRGSLKINGY